MPPKAKHTKEEILSAALQLIRQEGWEALTARRLGERLGSSARPLFTLFSSMDEIRQEALKKAREAYNGYVSLALSEKSDVPHFKRVGEAYIRFSMEEPELFCLLFMRKQDTAPDLADVLPLIDENYLQIRASIEKEYGMSEEKAHWLYQHLWIYTHGIATLCTTQMCRFGVREIGDRLTEVCRSLLQTVQGEKL